MRNLEERFLKVDGPFLPVTSPVPVASARFLAFTFRKVWSVSTPKIFCCCSYIFGITTYPLMDKWFPLLALSHAPKHGSWGLDGTKYWRLFIVEYLQSNKFKKRPNFDPIYQVSCFSSLGDASCFHVFPEKGRLSVSAQGKKIMFSTKNSIFPDNTRTIMCRPGSFRKDHLFRKLEENIIFPFIF